MSDKHFVAAIKIEKVEKATGTSQVLSGTTTRQVTEAGTTKRQVTEALHITVKSSTLDGLRTKVAGHLAILDEEDI